MISICANVCHRDLGSEDSVTRSPTIGPVDHSAVSLSVLPSLP